MKSQNRLNKWNIMKILFLIVLAGSVIIGGLSSLWLGDDNIVEEICEDIIEKETGQLIDLTPESPEKEHHHIL